MKLAVLLLIPLALPSALPSAALSQATGPWFYGVDVGGHLIHHSSSGSGAAAGLLVAAHGGRTWGRLAAELTLMHGFGEDPFTSFEPALQARLPLRDRAQALVGVGAGLMFEGTLSLPFFVQAGVGFRIREGLNIRYLGRLGDHANFGDPGLFGGPLVVSVGVEWN